MPDWFVYVLRCGDGSLYTGITTDVARRLSEHASGGPRAAKYLRGRGPLSLACSVRVEGKSAALALERWVKALPRRRKDEFVAGRLARGPDRIDRAPTGALPTFLATTE